jgi:hypothetical protein
MRGINLAFTRGELSFVSIMDAAPLQAGWQPAVTPGRRKLW